MKEYYGYYDRIIKWYTYIESVTFGRVYGQ